MTSIICSRFFWFLIFFVTFKMINLSVAGFGLDIAGWPILKTNQTGFQATGEGGPSMGHPTRGCRWENSLKKCDKLLS